jgi:hypothetical protein
MPYMAGITGATQLEVEAFTARAYLKLLRSGGTRNDEEIKNDFDRCKAAISRLNMLNDPNRVLQSKPYKIRQSLLEIGLQFAEKSHGFDRTPISELETENRLQSISQDIENSGYSVFRYDLARYRQELEKLVSA